MGERYDYVSLVKPRYQNKTTSYLVLMEMKIRFIEINAIMRVYAKVIKMKEM